MNLRWRLTGAANKPPCGAVAKSYGAERTSMKKKILFGLGTLVIAAALAVNVNMARNDRNVTLSLEQLGAVTQAQAEGGQQLWCRWNYTLEMCYYWGDGPVCYGTAWGFYCSY